MAKVVVDSVGIKGLLSQKLGESGKGKVNPLSPFYFSLSTDLLPHHKPHNFFLVSVANHALASFTSAL